MNSSEQIKSKTSTGTFLDDTLKYESLDIQRASSEINDKKQSATKLLNKVQSQFLRFTIWRRCVESGFSVDLVFDVVSIKEKDRREEGEEGRKVVEFVL
jgi:hypothetical protein